ncbi:Piwi domain-containing protein [Rhizophagus irregularis DAOM 181602=DAOM 197198]|nr:Piwi domain-containing protein [Rhizophagus irregularis DAOM 181602=DAOM 197198]
MCSVDRVKIHYYWPQIGTYFQKARNKRLIYPFLPCVVVRRDIFLEICDVIPTKFKIMRLMLSILLMSESDEEEKEVEEESEKNKEKQNARNPT